MVIPSITGKHGVAEESARGEQTEMHGIWDISVGTQGALHILWLCSQWKQGDLQAWLTWWWDVKMTSNKCDLLIWALSTGHREPSLNEMRQSLWHLLNIWVERLPMKLDTWVISKLEIQFACIWQVPFLKNVQYPWKPVTSGGLFANIEFHQILWRNFSFHSNIMLLLKIRVFLNLSFK